MSTPALQKTCRSRLSPVVVVVVVVPKGKSYFWTLNLSRPITAVQFSRRARLRLGFGLGTCYSIQYIYIYCFLLAPFIFSYWHKQLKFASLSERSWLAEWKMHYVKSVFLERVEEEREEAFLTVFLSFLYSLLSGVLMRRTFRTSKHFTARSKPEHCGAGFQSIYKPTYTLKHCHFIFTLVRTMS